jgi:N-acetylmuramic acid 6-phosphate etherase
MRHRKLTRAFAWRVNRSKGRAPIAPTEKRNPASRGLDQLSSREILRRMNREDARVAAAVRREIPAIVRAVDAIIQSIESGGRLIYAGAGSSGRIAVMDAAECPPTFGISPRTVRAVIAGGNRALRGAVEGAEDSPLSGARDMAALAVGPRDAVVTIAASGTTPYVLGALRRARSLGARTIALTGNPSSPAARAADISIALRTGAEMIAGSTRLKAGTAQKLVLNMLSTAAMVRLGHVYDNLMIDVAQTNAKLRRRAVAILEQATGARKSVAARALHKAGGNSRAALVMLRTGANLAEARRRLKMAGNNLRIALGE